MKIISRKNNRAYKYSIHNKDLLLTNFLPIENIDRFDEYINFIESQKVIDITSKISEGNGTLKLLHETSGRIYLLYTNKVGYVRYIDTDSDRLKILNIDLKIIENSDRTYFYEEIQKLTSIDSQLRLIAKHIIFNN